MNKTTQKLPIAVVITPTYNESANVKTLVNLLKKEFARVKNYQMLQLVVDDTSPDKTYEVVQDLQKNNPQLKLLINGEKAGLGGAYLKGMKYAFSKLNADVVFEFDADMQHDATKIPEMLKKVDAGADFVLGSRYIPGGSIPKTWGLWRKFLSVVGNLVIMVVLTDFRIHDWTSGFRAITKKVYEKIGPAMDKKEFQGYTFQVAFLHKTVRAGFKVAEVPFHFAERTAGESKLGTEYIKNNLHYLFSVRFQEIVTSRIFKFIVVGGSAALVQLIVYSFLIKALASGDLSANAAQTIATLIATELSIILNFIINNLWTFKEYQLTKREIPQQFAKFNFGALGSILIQTVVNNVGVSLFGLVTWTTILGMAIGSGLIYQAVGIIIGMFVNFFIYNRFIWRTHLKN